MRLVPVTGWPLLCVTGLAVLLASRLPAETAPAPRHDHCTGYCEILRREVARHPRLELADTYKLLHQATQGSEHAVAEAAAARRWFEREVRELGPGPEEPAVEPISPDGRMVRVHLRPYLAQGGDGAHLVDAFVRTANRHRGSPDQLRAAWACVEFLSGAGSLPYTRAAASDFLRQREAEGFPALHHSAAYAAAYRPAYRVVDRDFLPASARR